MKFLKIALLLANAVLIFMAYTVASTAAHVAQSAIEENKQLRLQLLDQGQTLEDADSALRAGLAELARQLIDVPKAPGGKLGVAAFEVSPVDFLSHPSPFFQIAEINGQPMLSFANIDGQIVWQIVATKSGHLRTTILR